MAVVYNDKVGDNIDVLLRKFRKEMEREGVLKELKDRQYFQKTSKINRQEKKRLEKRLRRKEKKRRQQFY